MSLNTKANAQHHFHTLNPPLFVRYEDEINKRASVENEFVLLKKVRVDLLL